MKKHALLFWPLVIAVALSCNTPAPQPEQGAPARLSERWAQLAAATGCPEVPRYIKFHELDPRDATRLLPAPTLQRGRLGRQIVLEPGVRYLYSVAVDGTFLVAEKARNGVDSGCGHPNLTLGEPARISGELNYDSEKKRFVMDNDSGRYGFQTSRELSHLEAAKGLLKLVGCRTPNGRRIDPLISFIQPLHGERYRRMDRIRPILKNPPSHVSAQTWRRRFLDKMGTRYAALSPPGHWAWVAKKARELFE